MSNEEDMTLEDFFGELGGGVFAKKAIRALKETGLGTAMYGEKGKVGKVTLTFTMARIGESNQVALKHALEYNKPTIRGHASEKDTTETPMYVGRGGRLTITPDTQAKFEFDKQPQG